MLSVHDLPAARCPLPPALPTCAFSDMSVNTGRKATITTITTSPVIRLASGVLALHAPSRPSSKLGERAGNYLQDSHHLKCYSCHRQAAAPAGSPHAVVDR